MDPNPKISPMLSYVLARIPTFGSKSDRVKADIEQPPSSPHSDPPSSSYDHMFEAHPRMKDPKLVEAMTRAVADVVQTRSVLRTIGERPDHEAVDAARAKLADIDASLAKQLGELVLSPRPTEVDRAEWRAKVAADETRRRIAAEKERDIYRAVVQLDEMHESYDKLLREAEDRLEKIYESAAAEKEGEAPETTTEEEEEVSEDVVGILQEASVSGGLEKVNISGRKLRFLPEAFGRIKGLRVLDVSGNQFEALPDSIAGLDNLEELNASGNILISLPDSIGLLQRLKLLNVSGNKLNNLPDAISHCRSLVELDASFNNLAYLPTNIGYELVNLEKLSIQLNKIRSLPISICEMKSLRYLDAHFNELRGLPLAIGKLTKLEVLNLSSNFSDMTMLPDTIGDLTNLKELDLSNNQIHVVPDTFGRLDNLTKLNLDGNPITVPPPEVVSGGVEAVKHFMATRWLEILLEEERKSTLEVQEQGQTGWLTRSTSWVKTYVSGVSEYLASPRTPKDSYLDQQL